MSRLFVAALLVIAILMVVRLLAPQTIGETARRQLLAALREHYPNYQIEVRRGHFDPAVGLTFEGLKISESMRRGQWSSREMIDVDRITISGTFQPDRLRAKQNPFVTQRVMVDGVHANAWIDQDNQVSLASLLPLPKFGPTAPRLDLRDVTLRLFGKRDATRPVETHLEEATIFCRRHEGLMPSTDPVVQTASAETISQQTTAPRHGVSARPPTGDDYRVVFQGSGEFIDRFSGIVEVKDGTTDLRVSLDGLRPNQTLIDRLPQSWTSALREVRDLSLVMDAKVAAILPRNGQPNFKIQSSFYDGRLTHARLPHSITNLRGKIVCDPSGIQIGSAQGSFGEALVRIWNSRSYGYDFASADLDLKTSVQGLLLDPRFAASLPPEIQVHWNKLQPFGRVDIHAGIQRRSGRWDQMLDIDCQGVDIQFDKFPYPVKQLVGRIEVRDHVVASGDQHGLSGRVGGSRLSCQFRLPTDKAADPNKWVELSTDQPVTIDTALLRSLTPTGSATVSPLEQFVRRLEPSGTVQLARAYFATDAADNKKREIDIRVVDGGLRYQDFPYRLYNVSGDVLIKDDFVQISGFRANNANAGTITCNGYYQLPVLAESTPTTAVESLASPPVIRPSHLELNFAASNVLMDQSLRQSLPPTTQPVWDAISPNGILDQLVVRVTKAGQHAPLGLDITAHQTDQYASTNQALSLRPPQLPYRLDISGGTVHFDGSRVRIDSIRASHDASQFFADGICSPGPEGRWMLALDVHGGSRLLPDAELIASLPGPMRNAMRSLQLRGPVGIRGKTLLALPRHANDPTAIDWDVHLQLEGNRIGDVGPVKAIRGGLLVKGHRDESILKTVGEVQLDSMHVYDQQVSNIRGPFSIVNDQLTLGSPDSSTAIEGRVFNGTAKIDGVLNLSSGNFDSYLVIEDGQVPTLLAEYGYGDQELRGSFSGQANLQGNLGTTDLLKGSGSARITDANLYKLPFLVQLFTLLSVNPNEDYAFSDGEVDFNLHADTVTFSDIQLWGDFISLQGSGTLDHRQDLDLTFSSSVSQKNSILRPLRGSRLSIFTIDVTGPMSDPQIQRRALDGFGEAVRQWIPGLGSNRSRSQSDGSNVSGTAQRPPAPSPPRNFRR